MARIEGKNPVLEALKGSRKVHTIYLKEGLKEGTINQIITLAQKQEVEINFLSGDKIDEMANISGHQGVIARGEQIQLYSPEELLSIAQQSDKPPFFVLLDHLQDPHNVGAIIRTAYAAGVDGLIFPSDRAAGITPVVLKTSAGATEHLPLARVANINYTIDKLKEAGVWVGGAELKGARKYYEQNLTVPLALVLGHEGQGLKRLVKEKCDFLLKIPINEKIDSLNVSVASGILLFDVLRQRDED